MVCQVLAQGDVLKQSYKTLDYAGGDYNGTAHSYMDGLSIIYSGVTYTIKAQHKS